VLWCLTLVAWLIAAAARWRVESRRRVPRSRVRRAGTRCGPRHRRLRALSLPCQGHRALGAGQTPIRLDHGRHLRRRPHLVAPPAASSPPARLSGTGRRGHVGAHVILPGRPRAGHRRQRPLRAWPRVGHRVGAGRLAWCVETARFGRPHYMPAASAALAAAAGLFVWGASSRAGGLAAAVAGAVLALVPLALRRKAKWRLSWALGPPSQPRSRHWRVLRTLVGDFGARGAGCRSRRARAARSAGARRPSAFVAFAAVCSLESWPGQRVGRHSRRDRRRSRHARPCGAPPQPATADGGRHVVARSGRGARTSERAWSRPPSRRSSRPLQPGCPAATGASRAPVRPGGVLRRWSLSAHTKWGLVVGPVFLLAGLLMFLGARMCVCRRPTSRWWPSGAWWSPGGCRTGRDTVARDGVDIVALIVGLGGPAVLMMASGSVTRAPTTPYG